MKKILFLSALAVGLASADTIAVYNTGTDAGGTLVTMSSITAHWTLVSQPVGGLGTVGSSPYRYKHPAYFGNETASAWVSPTASGSTGVQGDYLYRLNFNIGPGLNPASAVISGMFGLDNSGTISLNGGAPAATLTYGLPAFNTLHAFSFTSGFVSGNNYIDVLLNNVDDPGAFRVEFTQAQAAAVPEPGAAILSAGTAAALLFIRRRKA